MPAPGRTERLIELVEITNRSGGLDKLDHPGLDKLDHPGLDKLDHPASPNLDSFQTTRKTADVVGGTDPRELLRGAELRVTRPRVAVLDAVHAHPHADTDSLIRAARRDLPDVSHQAVYDVLRALTDAGLVRRIQPAGSVARYEARTGDNHHHVVCRSCGTVEDVDCATGETPCLVPSDDHGFTIDEAEVVYWGRCPACTSRS